eukprot:scaffold31784_cov67-Isochrysis_galbana.AAC.1
MARRRLHPRRQLVPAEGAIPGQGAQLALARVISGHRDGLALRLQNSLLQLLHDSLMVDHLAGRLPDGGVGHSPPRGIAALQDGPLEPPPQIGRTLIPQLVLELRF